MSAKTIMGISVCVTVALCTSALAVDPDVVSPLVSYQYLDTVSEPPAQPNVVSPVVSYQYFDWLGDSNMTFQDSLPVSYRFEGWPVITQQPQSQTAKIGTNVWFTVTAEGSAPLSYQWLFNGVIIPGQTRESLIVPDVQVDCSGYYYALIGNSYGIATSQVCRLRVYLPVATPQPENTVPEMCTQPLPEEMTIRPQYSSSPEFIVLGSGVFDRNKMTVVLTHGWNSSMADWPTEAANALIGRGYSSSVNIVAWAWHKNATIPRPDPFAALSASASTTFGEGEALGAELLSMAGAGYSKQIHFIGHSLGTLVNCRAADYIHGDSKSVAGKLVSKSGVALDPKNTHVTLLDEAELVTAINGLYVVPNILFPATSDARDNLIKYFSTKVIPDRYGWIDNYVSGVGLLHPEAANVLLWREVSINPFAPHGYAYRWYTDTVSMSGPYACTSSSVMGHFWSFERNSLFNSGMPGKGSYFLQDLDLAGSEFDLSEISSSFAAGLAGGYGIGLNRIVVYPTFEAYKGLYYLGVGTRGAAYSVVKFAGALLARYDEVYRPNGNEPVFLGTADSTPAFYASPESEQSYQADWDLMLSIQHPVGQQTQQVVSGVRLMSEEVSAPSNTVYAMIPVTVPIEAVAIAFEFRLEGCLPSEFFSMGISNVNYYTAEARHVEDGTWYSSGSIGISEFAGQDVQLIFSLTDDDMPDGVLSVRGIQFLIPPKPSLEINVSSNHPALSWPVSAMGWQLESVESLMETNWLPLTNSPSILDYHHTVIDDMGTGSRFYRLKK